jgi:hypothetical protein
MRKCFELSKIWESLSELSRASIQLFIVTFLASNFPAWKRENPKRFPLINCSGKDFSWKSFAEKYFELSSVF